MQQQKRINANSIRKIVSTILRWIGLVIWIILIWVGIKWASYLVITGIIIMAEGVNIYSNIKTKKSIWG